VWFVQTVKLQLATPLTAQSRIVLCCGGNNDDDDDDNNNNSTYLRQVLKLFTTE
jgi:hypothetical protein